MTARALPCYEPFDGTCHCCGNEADCKDTFLGYICAECRALCPYCGDALLGDYLTLDGKRMHGACAEQLDALADALVVELMPKPGYLVLMPLCSDQIGGAA